MTRQECLDFFGIKDMVSLPEAVWRTIRKPLEERDGIYRRLVALNGYRMENDWFQPLYEEELAERRQKKQDFTPKELGVICSMLTGQEGSIHEPTAGNGSMIISDWWERCRKGMPWEYFPSRNMVTAWELSERSLPMLLLNMSIRGIMGYVYHGDVLEQRVIRKYILLNRHDDALGFSEIIEAEPNFHIKKNNL